MQGTTQANKIWWYEWCKTQSNRREFKENGSNANTKICFEVRAPSSTSPPSHRRIFTNLSIQDSHTGNLHWGFGAIQPGVHNSSLNRIQPLTEARHKATQNTTSHKRGRHLANTNQSPHTWGIPTQTPPLTRGSQPTISTSLEGANHHSKINLYTRGISQVRRVTTWWSISTTNNFFHKIKIL